MPKNWILYQKTLSQWVGHAEKSNCILKNLNLLAKSCPNVCVCIYIYRMENRNQANQEGRMNEAPSASAGNGLIHFYYSLINIDEREWMVRMDVAMMYSSLRTCGFDDARGGGRACGGSAGGPSEHQLSLRAGAGRPSRAGGEQGESATCDGSCSRSCVRASAPTSSRMF